MAPRTREILLVSLASLLLTVAFTWPIAGRFASAGRLTSGDARFSIWNVSWVAHSLTTAPSNLWNANIFYPQKGTLAFSEANLVAGALGVPAWLVTRNAYATSNFTIFVAFILASVTMYSLVRYLTGSAWGAGLAAVAYAFCSYAFAHLGHIQLLMTFGPALALLRMHRFVDRPGVLNAIWLGLALVVQGLACGYYGLYGGLAVALGVAWFGVWSGQWRSLRFIALTGLAVIIAVGLTAPFLAPYVDLQQAGFARSLSDARLHSATWRDYFTSALLLYRWMLPVLQQWGGWHEVLFPGALVLGFTAVALWYFARRPMQLAASQRVVGFYVVLAALAFWGSLGPDAGLYTLVAKTVPFMSLLRAPARLGLFVTLAFAVLGGAGLATLERRWTGRRRAAWLAGITALRLASASVGPLELETAPSVSRAAAALRRLPEGAVAHFPFFSRRDGFHQQTLYMVASASHWRPMINGYSDFLPRDVEAAMPALAQFPAPGALQFLQQRGARYVLVHWKLYSPAEQGPLRLKLAERQDVLRPMLNDPDVSMFELRSPAITIEAGGSDQRCGPDARCVPGQTLHLHRATERGAATPTAPPAEPGASERNQQDAPAPDRPRSSGGSSPAVR